MRMVNLSGDGWKPYTGIWYRNDPSFDYYSGPMATFPSNIRPSAIYSASASKTFFTWGDKDSQICVGYYDHATGKLSDPVVIGSYTFGDAHKNGSLTIDDDGYIYCVFGGHGDETMRVRRTSSPLDISSWQNPVTLPGGMTLTYSQPWSVTASKIILLTRVVGVGQQFLVSSDKGATWSSGTTLIADSGGNGAYFISIAEQGGAPRKLHVMWNLYEGPTMRRNFYYCCSSDGGISWTNSAGVPYSLPIAITAGEPILDSGSQQVNTCDMQLDSNGLVRALVLQGLGTSFVWKVIRQNGPLDWSVFTLPPSADHHFDIGGLCLVDDDDWRAYLPSVPIVAGQDGGEMQEWQSTDRGENWTLLRNVTDNSVLVHNNVKTVLGGQPEFRAFWSFGDTDPDLDGTPGTSDVKLFMAGDDAPARQMAAG